MELTKLSPKVEAIYQAVIVLFTQGADLSNLTVSEITAVAGIGKGTAYEYFSNKEEMIAKALFYETQKVCARLYDKMKTAPSFDEKIKMLFDYMDEQLSEATCIYRIFHIMLDCSAISVKLKEIARECPENEYRIDSLVRQMVLDDNRDIEQLTEEQKEYLLYDICSKIISYAMYMDNGRRNIVLLEERMKEMLCEELNREVIYLKSSP